MITLPKMCVFIRTFVHSSNMAALTDRIEMWTINISLFFIEVGRMYSAKHTYIHVFQ